MRDMGIWAKVAIFDPEEGLTVTKSDSSSNCPQSSSNNIASPPLLAATRPQEILAAVLRILPAFFDEETDLFKYWVNERTLTHKLAEHSGPNSMDFMSTASTTAAAVSKRGFH